MAKTTFSLAFLLPWQRVRFATSQILLIPSPCWFSLEVSWPYLQSFSRNLVNEQTTKLRTHATQNSTSPAAAS